MTGVRDTEAGIGKSGGRRGMNIEIERGIDIGQVGGRGRGHHLIGTAQEEEVRHLLLKTEIATLQSVITSNSTLLLEKKRPKTTSSQL